MVNHDFEVADCGTIVLLTPMNESAEAWVDENLPDDRLMMGLSVAIEHRFALDIVRGLVEDGLTVRPMVAV